MPIGTYIQSLALSSETLDRGAAHGAMMGGTQPATPVKPVVIDETLKAAVDAGSLLSFVDGLTAEEREDVLYSVQLAHRSATAVYNSVEQTREWYQQYIGVLQNVGWVAEQMAFSAFDQTEGEFRMDKAALALITAIATQNQLAILKEAVGALEKLAENDGTIQLFDFHITTDIGGNFQIGAVQRAPNGALSMALGSFYFKSRDSRKKVLFVKWGKNEVNFWTAAQKMTLNSSLYATRRKEIKLRLENSFSSFLATLKI